MPQTRELHLRPSSRGLDPAALQAGRDLVLDIPNEHGTELGHGVLLDDHLDRSARDDVDRAALSALTAWHARYDGELTHGSFSVSDVWHGELFAEVFLPSYRVVRGVIAAARAAGAQTVVTYDVDPELVDVLRDLLHPVAVRVASPGVVARYPSEDAAPPVNRRAAPLWWRLARAALGITGVPSIARGRALIVSYYSTQPVLEQLITGPGPAPVLYAPIPPPIRVATRAARRGGWVGLPGLRHTRRAKEWLGQRLDAVSQIDPTGIADTPLASLLHRRALRCLRDRAAPSVALGVMLDGILAHSRLEAVITPFDGEPLVKVLVRVAQARGIPVLTIQHGYEPRKLFGAGSVSDAIGQWSQWDLAALPAERRGRARVVGNPGRGAPRPVVHERTRSPRAIILVEHMMRFSAAVDRRVVAQHLAAAVQGLEGSRYDWQITLRPHPADDGDAFAELARRLSGRSLSVDRSTPIMDLLAHAHACVGAFSTAALQTALVNTPLVMLMPQPIACVPPLDGSGSVRVAHGAEELSVALDEIGDGSAAPGREELLTALGCGPMDPIGEVVRWVSEFGDEPGRNASGPRS